MINCCRKNKEIPQKYIDDMNKMYNKCSNRQRKSKKLCTFVSEGIKHIPSGSEHPFQYAANVYNELLQLTKNETSGQVFVHLLFYLYIGSYNF